MTGRHGVSWYELFALVDQELGHELQPLVDLSERLLVVIGELDLLPHLRGQMAPLNRLDIEVDGILGRVRSHRRI